MDQLIPVPMEKLNNKNRSMSLISAHRVTPDLDLYEDKEKAVKQNFSYDDDDVGEEIL